MEYGYPGPGPGDCDVPTQALTRAIEDYLKVVCQLQETATPVTTQRLAAALGVACPSVTNMIKRLDALGLLAYTPYHGVALTAAGEQVAQTVLRRHHMLERYLIEQLAMPPDAVHAEAERLEHVISACLTERLAARLEQPTGDHRDARPPRAPEPR